MFNQSTQATRIQAAIQYACAMEDLLESVDDDQYDSNADTAQELLYPTR